MLGVMDPDTTAVIACLVAVIAVLVTILREAKYQNGGSHHRPRRPRRKPPK